MRSDLAVRAMGIALEEYVLVTLNGRSGLHVRGTSLPARLYVRSGTNVGFDVGEQSNRAWMPDMLFEHSLAARSLSAALWAIFSYVGTERGGVCQGEWERGGETDRDRKRERHTQTNIHRASERED